MVTPRFGISNMVLPEEGPQCIRMTLDFTTQQIVDVDLSDMIPDYVSAVQGIFIDNFDNGNSLQCTVLNGTGQRIIVPANSQLWTPILVDNPPQFEFKGKSGAPGIAIAVHFFNMPIQGLLIK